MPIAEALSALASGFGADAAALSRHSRSQDRPKAVALFDSQSDDPEAVLLRRPLAQDVLGYLYTKARSSTVWFLSDYVEDTNWSTTSTLQNWRVVRKVQEIAVIALAGSLQHSDYLEFHFARELAYSEKLEFEAVVATLVRAWGGRKKGLVAEAMADDRSHRVYPAIEERGMNPDLPILDVSNPARLSRAEFRVCLLLSRGLSVKSLTEELGLTESTIRSHLRSIYSKTNVSGIQELMYRMLNAQQRIEPGGAYGTR